MALSKTQTASPGPPISGQSFQAVGSTTTVKGTDLYVPDSRTLSGDPSAVRSGSERSTGVGRGGLMLAASLHSEAASVAAFGGAARGEAATCAGGSREAGRATFDVLGRC